MTYSYKIYLDVCCLNRPFDDQKQLRIRLETEAITSILRCCQSLHWKLITSTVIESEIEQTPIPTRKLQLLEALLIGETKVIVTQSIVERAIQLTTFSFKQYDALHLACAENNADILLTTDDRLLKKTVTYKNELKILVDNPVTWLIKINELTEEQNDDPN
jgi:predicted nucleic acid-binding protein